MKINREQVYKKYNGHCAYCGKEITMNEMQIDHFKAQIWSKNPDNSFENLMPSCAECNRYKSAWNIEVIRNWLEKSKMKLLKTQDLRILNRLGVFYIYDKQIKFYFEQLK
ncbi:MAG: HNH endonuclease [Candidatus Azobacteroides sp.]|nr:HNH endonuclease [Candidatus Azobacteroides sp.]